MMKVNTPGRGIRRDEIILRVTPPAGGDKCLPFDVSVEHLVA